MMHVITYGRILFYFVPQGGSFDKVNTIYFWPCVTLSQQEEGFPFGEHRPRWMVSVFFLFWAAGVAW